MPDKDVVLAKAAAIQRCLKRIKDVTGLNPVALDDQNSQDIFVLNLQRAVQSAIELGTHVIASEGLGMPDSVKGTFVLLERSGILSHEISGRLQSMVGFRNIAIHDYQAINVTILKKIMTAHLKDLEDFYTAVLTHFHFA
jgi:uncharacterized protein YutE (UPF0331/DUF86 family)